MTSRTAQQSSPITIDFEGQTYSGRVEIEGARILSQKIYYGTASKADSHRYRPDERTNMRLFAAIILRELVEEVQARGS